MGSLQPMTGPEPAHPTPLMGEAVPCSGGFCRRGKTVSSVASGNPRRLGWCAADRGLRADPLGRGRIRRDKSSGPPLLKPSLKVKRNGAHGKAPRSWSSQSQGLNARTPLKVRLDRTMGTNPVRVPLEQSGALGRPERHRARAASACPHAGAVSLTLADAAPASRALALMRNRIGPRLMVIIGTQCSWNDYPWVLRMCRMSE